MIKRKLGILTFSDGRKHVHEEMLQTNQQFLDYLVKALSETGELELVVGDEIIYTPGQAKAQADTLKCANVEGVIFNFSIWTFSHLPVIAANNLTGPFLLFAHLNPKLPGLVAMIAAGGCLDQLGIKHKRLWGDITDKKVVDRILSFARSSSVISRLKGQTCGLIGGRCMGNYSTAVDTGQWQNEFGVDLEHVDQMEVLVRAQKIPDSAVDKAFQWLTDHIKKIVYDGKGLTEEILKKQIRSYLATKEIIRDMGLDFIAIKCTPELSDNYVTQCLSQAFLNDPYDMEGKKEITVTGCEADLDGALTMQILTLLSDSPSLFIDLRHYDPASNLFTFGNCGSQSTYFAGGSDNPDENLRNVSFYPQIPFYFRGGGAAVQYMCAPGEITLARLARKNGKYWMAITTGEFITVDPEKLNEISPEWPQGFARLSGDSQEIISSLGSCHLHAVYGNYVNELIDICSLRGIDYKLFSMK